MERRPACGGAIRIFVEPLVPVGDRSADGVLHRLISDVEARHKVALALTDPYDRGAEARSFGKRFGGGDLAPALEDAFSPR